MKPISRGSILVVDDDRLVLAMLAHGLAQAGYEVFDADNGDDAILLARERRPDLALLDIRMQGKSGFDVAEYLRDHCGVPFMFLSAFSDEQTAAQVMSLGAVAYLVKPLDIGQILPVVGAAFARLPEHRAEAAALAAQAAGRPASNTAPAPEVLMAVGLLMQRERIGRVAAFERLHGLAAAGRLTPLEQAERLLAAVEASIPGAPD